MASIIIGARSTAPAARESGTVPFFTLNAKYLIDPASTTNGLGNDIGCMHDVLAATIQALVEATENDPYLNGLAFAALYQAQQVEEIAGEYVQRTIQPEPLASDSEARPRVAAETHEKIGSALSEAADAHHAIRATLESLQERVYSLFGANSIGMYEAAIASTEQLDRALARGLDAWGER